MTRAFRVREMSVGVARQYSGCLGKVGNCQIGVSINAATEDASCPLDWRLFIPKEWDEHSEWNQERREKTKLPADPHHTEKRRLALVMIDESIAWGLQPPPILGDGAYGDTTEFARAWSSASSSTCSTSRARPPPTARTSSLSSCRSPRLAAVRRMPATARIPPRSRARARRRQEAAQTVTWREGTRGKMNPRFIALRVRPRTSSCAARAQGRRGAAGPLADLRVALRRARADQVLALQPTR